MKVKSGVLGIAFLLTFLFCLPVVAESLYVVDHRSNLFSFDIVDNELLFRKYIVLPYHGYGGIDVAIDNEYGLLFITSETTQSQCKIDIVEAQSLDHIKTIALEEPQELMGVIYDAENQRLLGTERNSNKLYSYLWDPALQTLTFEEPVIILDRLQYACDLAINGNILYVSEYYYGPPGGSNPDSQIVYAYDMDEGFSYIEQYDMGNYTVAMDYHPIDDSIYGGSWMGSENQYIIKRSFDPNSTIVKDIGANVIGLASSGKVGGRVLVTTYRDGGTIEIWHMTGQDPYYFELIDAYTNNNPDNINLQGLAGLVVGEDYIEPRIEIEKVDDVDGCVDLYEELTYTICWHNPTNETAYDVWLIDYLPQGVTYPQAMWTVEMGDPNDPNTPLFDIIPPDPGYHADQHAYVWHLPDIGPYQGGCVDLTVVVNEKAEPGMTLYNKAVLTSSLGTVVADLYTSVCCWDTGTIIYVDELATGNDTGVSWQDAYTDLQRALARARKTTCQGDFEIWVAQGTYNPGMHPDVSFKLPDGVFLYGGFPTRGGDFLNRNPKRYKTTLSGDTGNIPNNTVVTMGNGTLLDGVTVTGGALRGIYGNATDFVLERCIVENNQQDGVRAENGNVSIYWSKILNNGWHGIWHIGIGKDVKVENCQINNNKWDGVRFEYSMPTVKNSVICSNGIQDIDYYGLRLLEPSNMPIIHNNTIVYNYNPAVGYYSSDPNHPNLPDIQNCIIWYNNNDGEQLGGNLSTQYSCVFDPNDPLGEDYNLDGYGNFSGNPSFAYTYSDDPNVLLNVHLAWDSPCRNMGNPYLDYEGQYDMDGEPRVFGERVDIGADEVHCEDIYNPFDWNADGAVNLREFALISRHWLAHDPNDPAIIDPNHPDHDYLTDPNSPGYINEYQFERWNSAINIVDVESSQYRIDLADLLYFLDEAPWLWVACWNYEYQIYCASQMMVGGDVENIFSSSTTLEEFTEYQEIRKLKSLEQSTIQILALVEEAIVDEQYNQEGLLEIRDFLYQSLLEIYEQKR